MISFVPGPSLGLSGDREREPGKRAIDTGMEISLAEVPQSPTSPNHHSWMLSLAFSEDEATKSTSIVA
jgi:hypothetical protein